MEPWKRKEFKIILKLWNSKLEQSGFIDHEIELKGDRALKQHATNAYRQAQSLERETRLDYYRLVGNKASNSRYRCKVEKFIMLRHADGLTLKEIEQELLRLGFKRCTKTIGFIIKRYQVKWGIRSWTPRQMNLKKTIRRTG